MNAPAKSPRLPDFISKEPKGHLIDGKWTAPGTGASFEPTFPK